MQRDTPSPSCQMLNSTPMVTGRCSDTVFGGFVRAYMDKHRKMEIQGAHNDVIIHFLFNLSPNEMLSTLSF